MTQIVTKEDILRRRLNQCPIPGCDKPRAKEHAMCRGHWLMVPADIRARIWCAYRDKPGSVEHLQALQEAHRAVRDRTGVGL